MFLLVQLLEKKPSLVNIDYDQTLQASVKVLLSYPFSSINPSDPKGHCENALKNTMLYGYCIWVPTCLRVFQNRKKKLYLTYNKVYMGREYTGRL